MKINEVQEIVGITKKNIRFYEDEGLIKPSRNKENGYRDYSLQDVEELKKIKLLRKLAVPIEEIRMMQQSYLTLDDCMKRHLISLERQESNLKQMQIICNRIAENHESLEQFPVDGYSEEMSQMEQEGTSFENIVKKDQKNVKRAGSIAAASVLIIYMAFIIGVLVYAATEEPIPLFMLAMLIVIPTVIIIAIFVALYLRMKEIKGGEEDEAAKY